MDEVEVSIELYPLAIIEDRYGGTYSRGKWLAIAEADEDMELYHQCRVVWCLSNGPHGDDSEAMNFWVDPPNWIASGRTEIEARENLMKKREFLT